MTEFDLQKLDNIIAARTSEEADQSYTASLLSKGTERCAKKFGEEAVEAVIAAMKGEQRELCAEAADVVYHLLVLLRSEGVKLQDVMAELESRTSQSGLEEKASRKAKTND